MYVRVCVCVCVCTNTWGSINTTNTYIGGAHGNGTKRPWMICGAVPTRYSIYLLYQYKSTNTDAEGRPHRLPRV